MGLISSDERGVACIFRIDECDSGGWWSNWQEEIYRLYGKVARIMANQSCGI